MRYLNDSTSNQPHLKCFISMMNLVDLPEWSTGPRGDTATKLNAIADAGYDGVEFTDEESFELAAQGLSLGISRSVRINHPDEAKPIAARLSDTNHDCATVHVGWGMESESESNALIESILEASDKYDLPMYVETHRATIFQDMWRTVQFADRYPELLFNIDLSHWYTGQEMVYGGFENKLAFIEPVLRRAGFVHGRIANPGSIQVAVDGNDPTQTHVDHFMTAWTMIFEGFLERASHGDYIVFAPELLSPAIYYARTYPDADGRLIEESDRWEQALLLRTIAKQCFEVAKVAKTFGV